MASCLTTTAHPAQHPRGWSPPTVGRGLPVTACGGGLLCTHTYAHMCTHPTRTHTHTTPHARTHTVTCTHPPVHGCIHVCTHMHTLHTCKHPHTHMCTHTYTCTHLTHIHTRTGAHTSVHPTLHQHAYHTCAHAHTHPHMYTYTHVHTYTHPTLVHTHHRNTPHRTHTNTALRQAYAHTHIHPYMHTTHSPDTHTQTHTDCDIHTHSCEIHIFVGSQIWIEPLPCSAVLSAEDTSVEKSPNTLAQRKLHSGLYDLISSSCSANLALQRVLVFREDLGHLHRTLHQAAHGAMTFPRASEAAWTRGLCAACVLSSCWLWPASSADGSCCPGGFLDGT